MNVSKLQVAKSFLLLVVWTLFSLPALAMGADLQDELGRWERVQSERRLLQEELDALEKDHQNFVASIENLKERGAPRREQEALLRENLRTVEELEILQRQLRDLDLRQERIRGNILDGINAERTRLERALREAASRARIGIVIELNALQDQYRQFSSPLPEADQTRIAQVLAMAREVAHGHPRAMLSAADELEDTEARLRERLEGLNTQIARLERTRRVERRSETFSEINRFFDEEQRNRRIGSFEVASETPNSNDRSDSGNESRQESEAGDFADEDMAADPAHNGGFVEMDGAAAPGGEEGSPMGMDGEVEAAQPDDEPTEAPEAPMERVELRDRSGADMEDEYRGGGIVERDLQRLLRERRELEEQVEELRQQAEELRRRARQ